MYTRKVEAVLGKTGTAHQFPFRLAEVIENPREIQPAGGVSIRPPNVSLQLYRHANRSVNCDWSVK
jgi:hypothetical protein